jgi:hypothetical protein
MASGASGEVVHCPNCKEDVPKTLYCLNCGFPLYKEEQPKEEAKVETEAKPESDPLKPTDEDAVIIVDDEEEEMKLEPKAETSAEPEVKMEVAPVEAITTPPEPEVKEQETAPTLLPEVSEKIDEPAPVVVMEEAPSPIVEAATPEPVKVVTPTDPASTPVEESKPVEAPKEVLSTGSEPTEIEAVEVAEEYHAPNTFVPDPLTKDLMENLVKSISLKIKLVKLYRDGVVKEETFIKLFEGYAAEGKIWYSRREELLKKLSAEIEEMEEAYATASEALELLEVRKSIGEASTGEYEVKAPAYRWDIGNFETVIGEKKNRIAYLENVSIAITDAELQELKKLASIQYNTLESLQLSKDEVLAQIKDSLYEAIKTLG